MSSSGPRPFGEPSFLALALRRPTFLFGAILVLTGVPFFLIGAGLAVSGSDETVLQWTFGVLGAGVLVVGGSLLWLARRDVRTVQRLWREGQEALGVVMGVAPTNVRVNDRRTWRMEYDYVDAAGRRHRGTSHHLSGEEASAWQPGDELIVRYDRARPERSVPVGRR